MSNTADESNTVTIKIKVLGSEDLHELTVPLSTTILSLKEKVAEFSNFPLESIRLIFRGRSLQNNEKLSTYKVEDGHTIIVHCSKSGQKTSKAAEDPPPPPPMDLNPPPNSSSSNQQAEPTYQQSPDLPPLPHNSVTDFKRELSMIQHNIAILLESATHLQMSLTRSNAAEINEAIQKYSSDSRQILQNTFNKIQSIQHTHFATNNSRVEVNEEQGNEDSRTSSNINNSLNNNRSNPVTNANSNTGTSTSSNQSTNVHTPQSPQPRPVVDDIFSPNDKAFIQQQISNLNDYVENNELDESYSSTDIYKQLN